MNKSAYVISTLFARTQTSSIIRYPKQAPRSAHTVVIIQGSRCGRSMKIGHEKYFGYRVAAFANVPPISGLQYISMSQPLATGDKTQQTHPTTLPDDHARLHIGIARFWLVSSVISTRNEYKTAIFPATNPPRVSSYFELNPDGRSQMDKNRPRNRDARIVRSDVDQPKPIVVVAMPTRLNITTGRRPMMSF